MTELDPSDPLDSQIDQWRSHLLRHQTIRPADVDELEDHLRGQVATLTDAGLASDEAFLVAVKRMGALDAISNEFAREHSERLWKQLVADETPSREVNHESRREFIVMLALAVAAALAFKVPELFGMDWSGGDDEVFYMRNFSFFVLPLLTGFFLWKRQAPPKVWGWLGALFALAIVFANIYPFGPESDTLVLTLLHLPLALWFVVGIAYVAGRWRESARRMDFVRFSGELFIYYVLIGLGGGVLIGFTLGMFQAIGIDAEWMVEDWLVPCGVLGAVIVGSWLVEAKQSVIENMAPVLTRLFTPLFAATLVIFLGTMVWTGRGINIEREVLIAFDLLLVLVLALLLYSVSARDRNAPRDLSDVLLVVLVISALITDGVALAAIGARISEFGFTPNRIAALGENVILLVNLAWSAWLYIRFMRGRGSFAAVERWQMAYLPVYALWAAFVVIAFPLIFGFG